MNIAFCLYKYFPYGGLQRDFLRVALTVASRGHHVQVFTQSWQGERPKGLEIILVPVTSRTNHGKNEQYYQWVQNYLPRQGRCPCLLAGDVRVAGCLLQFELGAIREVCEL